MPLRSTPARRAQQWLAATANAGRQRSLSYYANLTGPYHNPPIAGFTCQQKRLPR